MVPVQARCVEEDVEAGSERDGMRAPSPATPQCSLHMHTLVLFILHLHRLSRTPCDREKGHHQPPNSKPLTLNLKHLTPNPKPSTLTLSNQPENMNPGL